MRSFRSRPSPNFDTALSCEGGEPLGLRRLDAAIRRAEIVQTGPDLIRIYAELRVACERVGHALCQREHDADRWVAATALRLRISLVSNDRIFEDTPGLVLEAVRN